MANMSDYLENKMIDHLFRGLAYPVSTTLYVALSSSAALGDTATGTTMSEITGGAYARQAVVATTANWYSTNGTTSGASSGTNGTTSNVAAITFPTATADWGTVQAVVICDSATTASGNALFWGNLTSAKVVSNGDTFQFAIGSLSVQIDN
jgi:hypothetical protein